MGERRGRGGGKRYYDSNNKPSLFTRIKLSPVQTDTVGTKMHDLYTLISGGEYHLRTSLYRHGIQ